LDNESRLLVSTVDVTHIDVSSLDVNQADAVHDGHIEDVNNDGFDELVVHFPVTGILIFPEPDDREEVTLVLNGDIDGIFFSAEDTVIIKLAKEKSNNRGG
jgi:hypothetical protein